jgi:hypothetical protein
VLGQSWEKDMSNLIQQATRIIVPDEKELEWFCRWASKISQAGESALQQLIEQKSAPHYGYYQDCKFPVYDYVQELHRLFRKRIDLDRDPDHRYVPLSWGWTTSSKENGSPPSWILSARFKFTNQYGEEWFADFDWNNRILLLTGTDIGWHVFQIDDEGVEFYCVLADTGLRLNEEVAWIENICSTINDELHLNR